MIELLLHVATSGGARNIIGAASRPGRPHTAATPGTGTATGTTGTATSTNGTASSSTATGTSTNGRPHDLTDRVGHHDVTVEFAEGQRLAEVVDALAQHLGRDAPPAATLRLRCQRLGAVLDNDDTVVGSGLVSGDAVELVTQGPTDGRTDQERDGLYCDVISGPRSGSSVRLAPGSLTIGRSSGNDLQLEDPTVSKRHAELTVSPDGQLVVAPLPEVTNPVLVDGAQITEAVELKLGSMLELGACALVVRRYTPEEGAERDQLGQIPFNRTPYRHPDLSEVEVPGPGRPPAPYEPRPLVLLTMLAPAAAGLAFALILQRPLFLLFALLSPISMLANWWSERRRGGASHKEQVETFEGRMEEWLRRYDAALEEERHRRLTAAPDVGELARRAELRTPDLWSRSSTRPGYLQLRVGRGDLPAAAATPPPHDVDADPDGRIGAAVAQRRLLHSVPVVVDLLERGSIAFHGPAEEVGGSVAATVIQAAVLHSPDDMVVCAGLGAGSSVMHWLKWLPHTRSVASPLEGDHLADGTAATDDLLQRLLAVIGSRPEECEPRVLLVLGEDADADSLLVASLLEHGPDAGVHTLWVGRSRAMVPRQATLVVDHPPQRSGAFATLWSTVPEEPVLQLTPEWLDPAAAGRIARALTPVRDASLASAAASIPRVAPLLETLGGPSMDASTLVWRWSQPRRYGLPTPIGIGPSGTFSVDLVEHGPHALIAGTSGAGKSELLQSLIAGLVAYHPPSHVNLLFIDYKGGAASDVFRSLPHTVGHVTNLGADLALRALVSLRAELDRRMRILEGRAKDLEEMLALHPDQAPPSLVIVVDEFATLVKEIPDFVTGMVDIAQRGRSLGIHLILATQRPSGSVNDNILANTNLRISLRVLDAADSSSILGGPEAAGIPAPLRGRGFARLGAGALIEFQSAYSGAPFTAASGITPVVVRDFPTRNGHETALPAMPVTPKDEDQPTHLDVLLAAAGGATRQLGLQPGRRPWLEALPRLIPLDDVLTGRFGPLPQAEPGRDVLLGVRDVPEEQAQRPEVINLEATGGVVVFGTSGSGRTTTLRTMVASAIGAAGPQRVQVHVLDYGGRVLESLRDLPHVAAVASSEDLEQTTRVLMALRAEVSRRQALLAEARAEHLTAYHHSRPEERLPRLLLVLDGYEVFDRTFDRGELFQWSELLRETVVAGRAVGLHLLTTADRRSSVPAALHNAVTGRVILRTADRDGLLDLGIPSVVARDAELGDGRALVPGGATVQVAVPGQAGDNRSQTAYLDARARAVAGDAPPAILPALPEEVTTAQLPPAVTTGATEATGAAVTTGATGRGFTFPLGLADLTLATATCDVRLQPLAVIGPDESGRSTALATAAHGLRVAGREVWVVADAASPLAHAHTSGSPTTDAAERLATRRDLHADLLEALAKRARRAHSLPILVVDGVERLSDEAGRTLEGLLRDELVRVLVSADPSSLTGYVAGWAGQIKDTRRKLLLQPDAFDAHAHTQLRLRLRPGQSFPPGRGVLVAGRTWQLIQVARPPAPA